MIQDLISAMIQDLVILNLIRFIKATLDTRIDLCYGKITLDTTFKLYYDKTALDTQFDLHYTKTASDIVPYH